MAINLGSNFNMTAALPLDGRDVVADLTARDAIPLGVRYLGMAVHVVDSDGAGLAMNYQLVGGTANINWTEFAGGGGSGGMKDNTQAGASVTITLPAMKFLRLLGTGPGTLDAIRGIEAGDHGQEIVLMNYNLGNIILLNEAGALAGEDLFNGVTLEDIVLRPYYSAHYVYDSVTTYWALVGITNLTAKVPVSPKTVTANYTQLEGDSVILVDATLGPVIIYLLPCAQMNNIAKPLMVKKIDNTANAVTLSPDGSETIDGESSYSFYDQYNGGSFIASPTFWSIF